MWEAVPGSPPSFLIDLHANIAHRMERDELSLLRREGVCIESLGSKPALCLRFERRKYLGQQEMPTAKVHFIEEGRQVHAEFLLDVQRR